MSFVVKAEKWAGSTKRGGQVSVMQWPLQSLCQQVILSRSFDVPFERPRSNMALQPTRYGVPPVAAGNGLRP